MKIIKPNIKGIEKAAKEIINGEIVFIPTDTVYGIAASPYKEDAVNKIFSIKKRPVSSSLVLLCLDYKMAKKYAIFNKLAIKLINVFWPGPLTLILKKKPALKISKLYSSTDNSIGVRVPAHDIQKQIIKKCNFPIFCTSANISGKKSQTTVKGIKENFKNKKITIINGGATKLEKDSTVIDVTKNTINILREGCINKKKLNQFIQ